MLSKVKFCVGDEKVEDCEKITGDTSDSILTRVRGQSDKRSLESINGKELKTVFQMEMKE